MFSSVEKFFIIKMFTQFTVLTPTGQLKTFIFKIWAFSVYEVKNNCCLFERLFKVRKIGVFLFGISLCVFEIFTFLYYANKKSDDVINSSTKTIKYWIKNISRNIWANLEPEMYITKETKWHLLSCCHGSILGSSLFLWKTQYPCLQPFWVKQGLILGTDMVPTLSELSPLDCWEWMILV